MKSSKKTEIKAFSKKSIRQLFLNGMLIVEWHYANWREEYCSYFHNHNTELGAKLRDSVNVERAKKTMREIIKNTPNRKELAIKVRL